MTRAHRRCAAAWHAVVLGCAAMCWLGGCIGGQTGQEDDAPLDCGVVRSPIAPDAETGLGFTAAQVEAALAQPVTSAILWSRMNTRSELTLSLIEVRARFLNDSTSGMCADTIGLDALVSIATADGLLDERLPATVEAGTVEQATVVAEVAPAAVAGTLSPELLDLQLSNWRDPVLSFRLERGSAPPLRGSISLDGGDPDPNDDEVPVSAAIAELPAP